MQSWLRARLTNFSGLGWLLCATLACSPADPSAVQPAPAAERKTLAPEAAPLGPPSNAEFLCSGHVTGAPLPDGSPGSHINWMAFTSHQDPAIVIPYYVKALGASPTPVGVCATWRDPVTDPRATVDVCPATYLGPWDTCQPIPAGTRSIIMTSTLSGPN